jgi:hypothetical protein
MPGLTLAHAGDASGLGMLAFFPVALILAIGIFIVLRPAMTASGLEHDASADEDEAQDPDLEDK